MRLRARARLLGLRRPPSPEALEEARRQGYKVVCVEDLQVWIRDYSLVAEGE